MGLKSEIEDARFEVELVRHVSRLDKGQKRLLAALPKVYIKLEKDVTDRSTKINRRADGLSERIGGLVQRFDSFGTVSKDEFKRVDLAIEAQGVAFDGLLRRIETDIVTPFGARLEAAVKKTFATLTLPKNGADGADGAPGKDATLLTGFRGEYDETRAYKSGDTFTYAGSFYLTLQSAKGKAPREENLSGAKPLYAVLARRGSGGMGGSGVTSLIAGNNITLSGTTGDITISAAGGSGAPGGLTTQVQFNDAGSFAGNAGMTFAKASGLLTITGIAVTANVSGTGFATYLASPPAIGGTVAAAGSFTTLAASGAITGASLTVSGDVIGKGGQAANSYQLTSVNSAGGAFLAALGTNTNVRIAANGSGLVQIENGTTGTIAQFSSTGLLINTIASAPGQPLSLGTGTTGTAITILSANNNVGVGLVDPSQAFHIASATATRCALESTNTASAGGPLYTGMRSRGTHASPADVQSGDLTGGIQGRAYSGGTFFGGAEIDFLVDGTFTTTQRPPSRIEFYTNAANASVVLALKIDSNQIVTVSTASPLDNTTRVATTAYVDSAVAAAIQNFDIKDPVAAATTGALPFTPTYSNGSSGVGATLIGSVGVLVFDGYTPLLGDRLLIKNQGSTFQNGIYSVTTLGTVVVGYVLTRTTDFNQTSNILYGDSVGVLNGTTNANQQFTMNNQNVITVGTTAITFAQTSGGSQLASGNGIAITGNSVAIDTSVTVDKTTAQTLTNKTLTSPTLTTPVLGTPSSGILSACTIDGTNLVGFRGVPQNSQSTAYTTVLADAGKEIYHPVADTTNRTFTIDSNANVAHVIGTVILFTNMSPNNVTIAITSDTLYLVGTGSTGSRTLAQYGSAWARKETATSWLCGGIGLT